MSPESIQRVVLGHLGDVAHCQELGLREDPRLSGRVTVRFVIGVDGTVRGATIQQNSLHLVWVAECIANAVHTWRFPPHDGPGVVAVTYPFNLEAPTD